MRALLVANADDGDPGFVGHHLRKRGYAFTELLREQPREWPALGGADLIVLLGSEWSTYWPAVAESVEAEAALVREAARSGLPMLAICFGSQVVAHALGGTVGRAARPEIGWVDDLVVDPDVARVGDDQTGIAAGPWLEWHSDVVTLPPGATELARNPCGPQVWRHGRILATQFHPEATETMLARWSAGGHDELAAVGLTRDELMAQTRDLVKASRKHAEGLTDWFLEHVAGG